MTAYIHYLLVRPEYQRQEIGKTLIEMVKEQYKNYLYLIVISEDKKNIGFYVKSSFTEKKEATPLQVLRLDK